MNAPAPSQARLVIVGATGMVGGYALRYALNDPAIGLVTAIGRRSLGIPHPKLKEVLNQDFADCSALTNALTGQDAAVFCLGAYTGAVSDAALRKVTVDYTIEFARVLRAASPAAAFSFLSGSGPDWKKPDRFRTLQGRGRERIARGGFSSRDHLPSRLHLSRGAPQRTKLRLSLVAHNLSRVPAVGSQSGDPCR
jgi:hypothetical protein